MLCRMSDALFFHLNRHCDEFRGTMQIELAKMAWLIVALGNNAQIASMLAFAIEGHILMCLLV